MKKTNQILVICAMAMVAMFASCELKSKKDKGDVNEQVVDYENLEDYFCYPSKGFNRPDAVLNYEQIVTRLREYDVTRIEPLEKALGYRDTRINTFNIKSFIKYLKYIKKLTKGIKNEKVEITGISFISAAKPNYKGTGKSYQDLIYIPTTTINGKQVPFDAYLSDQRDTLVTFKEALAENGYRWIYDSREDYKSGIAKGYDYSLPVLKQNSVAREDGDGDEDEYEDSSAGNYGSLVPPY